MTNPTQRILHPQWRDVWETTAYPFEDQTSLTNSSGESLPRQTFLDAHLYPVGAIGPLRLGIVAVGHEFVSLSVLDQRDNEVCRGIFATPDPPDNIELVDPWGRPAGLLVSSPERLSQFQTWGVGEHRFDLAEATFCSSVCMPSPEIGVRGILLEDGTLLTGQVWVIGDDGVVVRYESGQQSQACSASKVIDTIRVDIVGDPLFKRRLCGPDDTLFDPPQPIRKLRITDGEHEIVCPADDFGDFSIRVNNDLATDTALRIRQVDSGLLFETVGSVSTDATVRR